MDLINNYNLPKYIKGKSFSEASKMINKKFKDRNDIISLKTRDELLERLKMAQEGYRKAVGLDNNNSYGDGGLFSDKENFSEDMDSVLNGASTALNFSNYAFGNTGIDKMSDTYQEKQDNAMNTASMALKGASAGSSFGPIATAIGGIVGLGSGLIGGAKRNKEINLANTNKTMRDFNKSSFGYADGGPLKEGEKEKLNKINKDTGLSFQTLKDAEQIFEIPNNQPKYLNFGKYSNNFSSNPYYKDMGTTEFNPLKVNVNNYRYINNKNVYDEIRKLNPDLNLKFSKNYKNGSYLDDDRPVVKNIPVNTEGLNMELFKPNNKILDYLKDKRPVAKNIPVNTEGLNMELFKPNMEHFKPKTKDTNTNNNFLDYLKNNSASLLRYAPVATNVAQLLNMKKPSYEHLQKLSNKYKPIYEDEKKYQNIINSEINSQSENIANSSAGSLGTYRSNMLGVGINKIKALNDAYNKIKSSNNAENKTKQIFDTNIDKINLQQSNRENEINARNQANYDTQKSKLISQLGNDLGNIGTEEMRKKYPEKMGFMYNSKGEYIGRLDENGNFISVDKDKDKNKDKNNE